MPHLHYTLGPVALLALAMTASLLGQSPGAPFAQAICGFSALGALVWALRLRPDGVPWPLALAGILTLWLVVGGIVWGVDPESTVSASKSFVALLAGMAVGMDRARWRWVGYAVIALVAAQVPALYWQLTSDDPNVFVRGLFLDSNGLSALALAGVFLLLASHPGLRGVPYAVRALGLAFLLVVWALPQSRGSILALLAVGAGYLFFRQSRARQAAALVVGAGLAGAAWLLGHDALTALWGSIPVQDRLAMWDASVRMWLDQGVLTGAGLGSWYLLYPLYRTRGDVESAGSFAHSDPIQLLAEGGPLAAGLYLTLGAIVTYQALRRLEGRPALPWMALGAAVFWLHGLVNFLVTTPILAAVAGVLFGGAVSGMRLVRWPRGSAHELGALGLLWAVALGWVFVVQAAKQAAFVPGSGYSTYMPYLSFRPVQQLLAKTGSATAWTTKAVQDYVDAKTAGRSPEGYASAQDAVASLAALRGMQPWRVGTWTLEASLRRELGAAGLLGDPAAQYRHARDLVDTAARMAPNDLVATRAKAELIHALDGCDSAGIYLKRKHAELSVRSWRRQLERMRLTLCGPLPGQAQSPPLSR